MAILLLFLLGIANFAIHKAVLESRRRLIDQLPRFARALGGRASLVAEFLTLAGAMLMVRLGYAGWGWGYLAYSAFNAAAGWFILTRRI